MKAIYVLVIALATAVIRSDEDLQGPVYCNGNRFRANSKMRKNNQCPLEEHLNEQISLELRTFYEYLNLGYFFAHEDYNLPYFSKYFLNQAKEELKQAQDLMQNLVLRGAEIKLTDIVAPPKRKFSSSCEAIKHAYELERSETKEVEHIWRHANELHDVHLADHLETNFVTEQYESLKKLEDMHHTLTRMGVCIGDNFFEKCDKLSEFQFDQTVMKDMTSS